VVETGDGEDSGAPAICRKITRFEVLEGFGAWGSIVTFQWVRGLVEQQNDHVTWRKGRDEDDIIDAAAWVHARPFCQCW
jgi:hypothetical protein